MGTKRGATVQASDNVTIVDGAKPTRESKVENGNRLPRMVSLNGDRKKINACKKIGLPLHNPRGEWNGYGYKRLSLAVTLSTVGDVRKFNKVCKETKASKQKVKTYEEKKADWCKRLNKLTGITIEEAKAIADEKEDYKEEQISELEYRQTEHYSRRRETLINKVRRSNPLRYIKNSEHADNIIVASNRHQRTNYENLLGEGRERALIGEIDRSEVRDFARSRIIR